VVLLLIAVAVAPADAARRRNKPCKGTELLGKGKKAVCAASQLAYFINETVFFEFEALRQEDAMLRARDEEIIARLEAFINSSSALFEFTNTNSTGFLDTGDEANNFQNFGQVIVNAFERVEGDTQSVELALSTQLSVEEAIREGEDSSLSTDASNEEAARMTEDSSLSADVSSEEAARMTMDSSLSSDISSEASVSVSTDVSLLERIVQEDRRSTRSMDILNGSSLVFVASGYSDPTTAGSFIESTATVDQMENSYTVPYFLAIIPTNETNRTSLEFCVTTDCGVSDVTVVPFDAIGGAVHGIIPAAGFGSIGVFGTQKYKVSGPFTSYPFPGDVLSAGFGVYSTRGSSANNAGFYSAMGAVTYNAGNYYTRLIMLGNTSAPYVYIVDDSFPGANAPRVAVGNNAYAIIYEVLNDDNTTSLHIVSASASDFDSDTLVDAINCDEIDGIISVIPGDDQGFKSYDITLKTVETDFGVMDVPVIVFSRNSDASTHIVVCTLDGECDPAEGATSNELGPNYAEGSDGVEGFYDSVRVVMDHSLPVAAVANMYGDVTLVKCQDYGCSQAATETFYTNDERAIGEDQSEFAERGSLELVVHPIAETGESHVVIKTSRVVGVDEIGVFTFTTWL
jgi:hypothetical protein